MVQRPHKSIYVNLNYRENSHSFVSETHRHFGRALLPLRFMLGLIWLMGGFLNISDVYLACGFSCGNQRYVELISKVWAEGVLLDLPVPSTLYLSERIPPNPIPGMSWFLKTVVAPQAGLFMVGTAVLEILVGASLLLGAFMRISPVSGMLLNVAILLAAGHTHPGILRVNLLMAASALTLYMARSGGYFGLDVWLAHRLRRVPFLQKLCAT